MKEGMCFFVATARACRRARILKNNGGSSLLGAVVISAVVSIAIAGLIGTARNTAAQGMDALDETKAFLAAEAGLKTLTGWVSQAVLHQWPVATVGHPADIITKGPGKTIVKVGGREFEVELEIEEEGRPRHWILRSTADAGLAYSTTVEWVVNLNFQPEPGNWGNNLIYARDNLTLSNTWIPKDGNLVVEGSFETMGGGSFLNEGNMYVGGNFYNASQVINNNGNLRVGGHFAGHNRPGANQPGYRPGEGVGNIINNNGEFWVEGDVAGIIRNGANANAQWGGGRNNVNSWNNNVITNGTSSAGDLKPTPPPTVTAASIISGLPQGVAPLEWTNIPGRSGNQLANTDLRSLLMDAVSTNPTSPEFKNNPRSHVFRCVDNKDHVVIRIGSDAMLSGPGVALPDNVNVIFIVDGNNAQLRGDFPVTSPNSTAMVYVGPDASLGEGGKTLMLHGDFNGLIYVDEDNTKIDGLTITVPGAFNGALYTGKGHYSVVGGGGDFVYKPEILNRYTNFIAPPNMATPPPIGILSRMDFRTRFHRLSD